MPHVKTEAEIMFLLRKLQDDPGHNGRLHRCVDGYLWMVEETVDGWFARIWRSQEDYDQAAKPLYIDRLRMRSAAYESVLRVLDQLRAGVTRPLSEEEGAILASREGLAEADVKTYVVKIIAVDLTDVPPARSTIQQFQITCRPPELDALRKRAKKLFRKFGDGNDEHREIVITEVGASEQWTTQQFGEYLDGFARKLKAEG